MNPQPSPPAPPQLRELLYRSTSCISRRELETTNAVASFARRNAAMGLTGFLHLEDGTFYQVLEGPPEALEEVWQSIQRDPRHRGVHLLSGRSVEGRRFGSWAMGFTSDERRSLFEWTAHSGSATRNFAQSIVGFLRRQASDLTPE